MKMTFKKLEAMTISFAIVALPMIAYGAGLIPCGDIVDANNIVTNPCTFDHLITLTNNIIKFLMFTVAVPLAALGFMWAGASLVLNQDKESAWSEAKERFTDIAKGFGIMLGAYVLIKGVIYSFLTTDQITFMQFMFQ